MKYCNHSNKVVAKTNEKNTPVEIQNTPTQDRRRTSPVRPDPPYFLVTHEAHHHPLLCNSTYGMCCMVIRSSTSFYKQTRFEPCNYAALI